MLLYACKCGKPVCRHQSKPPTANWEPAVCSHDPAAVMLHAIGNVEYARRYCGDYQRLAAGQAAADAEVAEKAAQLQQLLGLGAQGVS
jgi:hypothetical protein